VLAPASVRAQTQDLQDCWTFPETGKTLCGLFLAYWRAYGGLSRFGLPLSDRLMLQDGTGEATQYFERAIFKPRASSYDPGPIGLAPLGANRLYNDYRRYSPEAPLPALPDNAMPGDKIDFGESWYPLRGVFLRYWQTHGGATVFGYPISPLMLEESEMTGQQYIVQYFNDLVFEYHPENAPPNDVLLSQLGTFEYMKAYPQTGKTNYLRGDWCNPYVKLHGGMSFEYSSGDSAEFLKPAQLVFGRFEVAGYHYAYWRTRPYPGWAQEVTFTGRVKGDTLTYTMTYDFNPDFPPETQTLRRGACP
jgi:hypothetical protein